MDKHQSRHNVTSDLLDKMILERLIRKKPFLNLDLSHPNN